MNNKINEIKVQGEPTGDILKGWVMVILTMIFVSLYTAALVGWLRPLADVTMITRLEPVIFVIIGYYFGRLPAQANEKTLKDEIDRHTKKTEASQYAKETAEKEREVIEERLRNVKVALLPGMNDTISEAAHSQMDEHDHVRRKNDAIHHSIMTAIKILES